MRRATPFSGKKKKAQLQEKRNRKAEEHEFDSKPIIINQGGKAKSLVSQWDTKTDLVKTGPRYNQEYQEPITRNPPKSLEVSFDQIHRDITSRFVIPSRPHWSFGMSKEDLEVQEQAYFQQWQDDIYRIAKEAGDEKQLSYFEHNLEVWRQLWRVCEMAQVVVVVVDIRHPVLHLPPSLYQFVNDELRKPMCIALMKTDLVPPSVLQAWKDYILANFPEAHLAPLSIYNEEDFGDRRAKRYKSAAGVDVLVEMIQSFSDPKYAKEWAKFKADRLHSEDKPETVSAGEFAEKEYFTIGFIGHPNAGKSSLINSIVGKKVVSASRTPGHTKHFQTIHLTSHIRVCDCPGLVFPMLVPKWLQILSGIYNVAQVKDPYEPILHLAEHIDLAKLLKLSGDSNPSVLGLCESVAIQKGFYTAKAARPDVYRAGTLLSYV
jgi:ribosome biogenesis GTPase A